MLTKRNSFGITKKPTIKPSSKDHNSQEGRWCLCFFLFFCLQNVIIPLTHRKEDGVVEGIPESGLDKVSQGPQLYNPPGGGQGQLLSVGQKFLSLNLGHPAKPYS